MILNINKVTQKKKHPNTIYLDVCVNPGDNGRHFTIEYTGRIESNTTLSLDEKQKSLLEALLENDYGPGAFGYDKDRIADIQANSPKHYNF